jgi:hypothetical protein
VLPGPVDINPVLEQVIDPPEFAPHTDRPGNGSATDTQHVLDLVEQFHGLAAVAVQLVDEGDDGGVAHPADLHQLDGPFLHALGAVDDHQR